MRLVPPVQENCRCRVVAQGACAVRRIRSGAVLGLHAQAAGLRLKQPKKNCVLMAETSMSGVPGAGCTLHNTGHVNRKEPPVRKAGWCQLGLGT
jgi:hypothetical protein